MDDQHAGGALTKGLFVLEAPPPIVGERAASEEGGVVGGRLVGEQQDDLAGDIGVFVVVPAEFRGDDAMSDEDDAGVEIDVGLLAMTEPDESVGPGDSGCGAAGTPGEGRGRAGLDGNKRDLLKVAAVAGRKGAGPLELIGDVVGRECLTGRSRFAALHIVAGEDLDGFCDSRGADRWRLGLVRRRRATGEEDRE